MAEDKAGGVPAFWSSQLEVTSGSKSIVSTHKFLGVGGGDDTFLAKNFLLGFSAGFLALDLTSPLFNLATGDLSVPDNFRFFDSRGSVTDDLSHWFKDGDEIGVKGSRAVEKKVM